MHYMIVDIPDAVQDLIIDTPMRMWTLAMNIWLIMAVLLIPPFWFIFSKAGFSKWLSLLIVVPMVNIVILFFLAFSTWPSHRQT